MHNSSFTRRALGSALAGLLALSPGVSGQASYRDHAALTAELQSLASDPAASLSSIGTTLEGRDIWLVQVANPGGTPVAERPGVLVVANLTGKHLVGSSHAVEIVRYLLGSDAGSLLDETVVYVVPRLNPDGAEQFFASPRNDVAGNRLPFDGDNDGRVDEDGPEDLNGDGAITVMRVPDESGAYMELEADPRLLATADPDEGESGAYEVYWEGTDDDGDGFYNEDWVGGVDIDRNFQHAYPYYGHVAGPHMVSERESRALMDFVISHRNIAAILTFGLSDNLVTPPNGQGELADAVQLDLERFAAASNMDVFENGVYGSGGGGGGGGFGFGFFGGGGFRGAQPGRDNDPNQGRRPSTTVHRDDQPYFRTVSDAYREITGIESIGLNREAEGAFFQYGYFQFGVPSFSTPGWGLPEAASDEAEGEGGGQGGRSGGQTRGGDDSSADARLLGALEGAGIDAFAEWTPYDHPQLGQVEIGGFLPFVTVNPPEAELAELGRAHGEFVERLAGMLPRVRIVDSGVTAHGGGVFTVEVEVENAGFLPTALQHGVVAGAVDPTTVQIMVDPDDVLTGAAKTGTIRKLDGSGVRERFTWVIRGSSGSRVEIRVRAQKGGTDTTTVTLG